MKKPQPRDLIWAAAFAGIFALILYKCPFGFASADESFYLTIPYRLVQGDALMMDEWNPSQFSLLLLYPLVKGYLAIAPSAEGMLLTFRYLFTLMHSCTALFLYAKLRSRSAGAWAVSLLYLVFTPFGVMALSYNSIGLALMTIACVLVYCSTHNSSLEYLLAGFLFSGAVLCCPFLVCFYLVYSIGFWICRLRKIPGIPPARCFWAFTGGCASAAGVFLLFLFSRTSLAEFLQTLPIILQDPTHPIKGPLHLLQQYFSSITLGTKLPIPLLCSVPLLALAVCLDRHRQKHRVWFFLAGLAVAALQLFRYCGPDTLLNLYMLPLAIPGLICLLLEPKLHLREALTLWLPGVLYGFCLNWGSDTRLYVIANGAMLSTFGSILMVCRFCQSLSPGAISRKICRGCTVVLLSALLLCTAWARWNSLFDEWYLSMADMEQTISVGVEKGVHTTFIKKEFYENLYADSAPVRTHPGKAVLYYSKCPWLYLEDSKRNASYSAWNAHCNEYTAQKLILYYTLDPSRMPDIAYGEKQAWTDSPTLEAFFLENGYQKSETSMGVMFQRPQAPS